MVVERPETGINLTVTLPSSASDVSVAAAARRLGVRPVALSGYYAGRQRTGGLLLGFAALPRARARWAAEQLRRAIDVTALS